MIFHSTNHHQAKRIRQYICLLIILNCSPNKVLGNESVLPLTDPDNSGNWTLNHQVSDEFDASILDEGKWYVVGKFENGKPVYKHPDFPNKRVWKGRAPSQFSGKNYRLEDGKLILETRWEPDFPFESEIHKPVFGEPLPYENITTACIIGRKLFKYGYIEIKAKAADAAVSSAFWSMGERLEIDFFELFGAHDGKKSRHIDRQLWWSIRDWNPSVRGKPTYTEKKDLGFRIADDFHVYGFDWSENGIKYYIDGELISNVTTEMVNEYAQKNLEVDKAYQAYVATKPISLWLDQETFPWNGVPKSKADLEKNSPAGERHDGIVDFKIEYIRVWNKLSSQSAR